MNKLLRILLGKKYYSLTSTEDQRRYIAMISVFTILFFVWLGYVITLDKSDIVRVAIDAGLALLCLIIVFLVRSKISINKIPQIPVIVLGIWCIYQLAQGNNGAWQGAWIIIYPVVSIFLCGLTYGIITSGVLAIPLAGLLFSPWRLGFYNIGVSSLATQFRTDDIVLSTRLMSIYLLVFAVMVLYERSRIIQNRKATELNRELGSERDIVQTMKDNMNLGIFLMNRDLLIQPLYSRQLSTLLSKYDENLDDKNFIDLLSTSINTKQQKILAGYFNMIFNKSKSLELLAEANPLSEFEYKIDNKTKFLSAKFQLIEHEDENASQILGIVEDITEQKVLSDELSLRKQEQEQEMKNLFDVLQISPIVFDDFIDTVNDNFDNINAVLKNQILSEREVVTKFFQNIHAIKSNAAILGLENFSKKLHTFETEIKKFLNQNEITQDDIFHLTLELESYMKETDEYLKITQKLQEFRAEHKVDNVVKSQLEQACKRTAAEQNKEVVLEMGDLNEDVLETELRKPIKEILLQFIRNSIHHGFVSKGTIKLSLAKEGNTAILDYADNGYGINFNKLKEKYLLEHPNTTPTTKDLISYIFKPEVSTSQTVEMSGGRGVGLSLVKDLLDQHGGKMSIGLKNGLSFKIIFPLPKNS